MLADGELLAGRYRLDALLGRGGMGEVWRATDLRLGRAVAIKALLPHVSDDSGRFSAEARIMASLHHPGIVNIYDFGDSYLVLEFVDGKPLSTLLDERGKLDSSTTARLTAQIADALQVVHDAGIVHRDVKPGNILVDSAGNARLTDFGVAITGDTSSVLGTARYMAPEQAMGHPVGPPADIYALGAVAYHCVAGHPPFDGEDAVQIALHHVQDQPPALPPETAPTLRAAIERAMAKEPADRYPNAASFAEAVQIGHDSTLPLAPVRPPRPARTKAYATAAGVGIVALLGILLATNLNDRPVDQNPGPQQPAAPASGEPSPTQTATTPARRPSPTVSPTRSAPPNQPSPTRSPPTSPNQSPPPPPTDPPTTTGGPPPTP